MTKKPDPLCCFCGLPYERVGNNPAPLDLRVGTRCCDACNEVVTWARMFPAEIMDEIARVERAIFGKLRGDTHLVTVAAICAMRGPGLLDAKRRDLAKLHRHLDDDMPDV